MKELEECIAIGDLAESAFNFCINPANTLKWVDGVVEEEANESPTRVGTIYRNKDTEGEWREFEITEFEAGKTFTMRKLDDDHFVKYTFTPLDENSCELEYYVWTTGEELRGAFNEENVRNILAKLKSVLEGEAR